MANPTEAYIRSLQGDFQLARAYCVSTAQCTGADAAWRLLLGSADWFTDGQQPAPDLAEVLEFRSAEPEPRAVAAQACIYPALAGLLDGDSKRFNQWHTAMRDLAEGAGPAAEQWMRCFAIWEAIRSGHDADSGADAEALRKNAVQLKDSALLVTATTQSALIALSQNNMEDAIKFARRASRISRTEAQPQFEYLANWVLARIRRASGRPHLATRIVDVLLGICQPRWKNVLLWEFLLAGRYDLCRKGMETLSPELRQTPLALRTAQLADTLFAARRGDRVAFDTLTSEVGAGDWAFAPRKKEARAVVAALDPVPAEQTLPAAIRDWASARSDVTPADLNGFVPPPDKDESWGVAAALVYAHPNGHVRRALVHGAKLVPATELVRIDASKRGKGRVEQAACTLASHLAGGMPTEDLFTAIYGFDIDPHLHDAAFVSLVHRVRTAFSEAGQVQSEGGRCQMTLHRPVLIPDTRCRQAPGDRVLQLLARLGKVSAKEAAEILGMPLRSVQAALQLLSKEGSCAVVREGRQVQYLLEDTTFHEPTLAE